MLECTSESLGAFLVSWCSSEGILPLRITAASTEIFIERGADWCGLGKNNYILEGCGMNTCLHGYEKMVSWARLFQFDVVTVLVSVRTGTTRNIHNTNHACRWTCVIFLTGSFNAQ